MDAAKIRLSPEEAALVIRADLILTKNRIIQKAGHLLARLQATQQEILHAAAGLTPEVIRSTAKISKGENYQGLPYLVLDQPRIFEKEDTLAVRTLFWWGNFFSTTLHLSGRYKIKYERNILSALGDLGNGGFFICSNDDPWQHHFEAGNYIALAELPAGEAEKMTRDRPFIKLSKKIDLGQWDTAEENLQEIFSQFICLLEN